MPSTTLRRFVHLVIVATIVLSVRTASAQSAASTHPGAVALMAQLSATPPLSDTEFVRRFVAPAGFAWVPETTLVAQLALLRSQTGGLRVLSAEPRGRATALRVEPLRGEGRAWIDIYVEGEQLMPWGFRLDHFARSGPPPALPAAAVPADSVLPIVQRWLDWWERHDRWSGTLGIARHDTTLYIRPIGFADRDRRTPNTADTRFHLGSSNKMLTAVAVLQLVRDGRVRLDDPIATYLPDYPKPELAQRITVRHLLTHTAGLGGLWELPGFEPRRRYGSNAAYIPLLADREPLFEPGTRYSYSNEGFVLAGAVIERATGKSYDAVLAERILGPAGMRGWCDCMGTPDAPRRARGYSHREDRDPLGLAPMTDNEYFVFAEGMAAGGYYATAEDYLRFAAAMRRGVLLDTASQREAFTRGPHSPAPRGYGLGFQLMEYGGKPNWGHGGGGGRYGIGTQFATFADGSWTVAVMGNRDLELANQVLQPLMSFLARQP